MTKKKIKIGMLGFGAMGKAHTYAIKNFPLFYPSLPFSAEVYGVCTRSAEKSEKICRDFGVSIPTTNEDELIYNPEIDVIDICTPNICHYETIMKAIDAGKHIYCEKPLCISYKEAKTVEAAAKEKGIRCAIVFNNRFMPAVLRAKQLVDDGRLGRILSFSVSYYHDSASDTKKPAGWKQNKDICGGGVLFDLGSHVIDMIYNLCGEFKSVSAFSQIAYPVRTGIDGEPWETNADEAIYMLAELTCGARGTITASKIHTGTNDDINLEIYGEKGAIKYSLMEPNWLHFYDRGAVNEPIGGERGFTRIECCGRYEAPGGVFPSPKAPVGWLMGHVTSYMSFLTTLYETREFHPNFTDGAYVQRVMEAAYLSSDTGKIVSLDEIK